MSGSIAPFLGEHLQLGVGPSGELLDSPGGPALSEVGASVSANYVFGGDAHWRGYVGGFGSAAAATHSWSSTQIGAQVGALYFLTPALAIRGEVRRREIMTPTAVRSGFWNVFVTLDPYAFGAASLEPIAYPGLGTVDVMGTYAFDWDHGLREGELTGTVAPYLTRWAQVGVDGELLGWSNAPHMHRLRGFGRLYLPLTVRTQPFAESFAETNTLTGATGGLTSYGGELGVRRMLDANVAIDVGVKRELHPAVRFDGFTRHDLGTTALVIGMMTRIGHAH